MGRLLLIVSVLDHERLRTNGRPRIYTGAFIEVMRWVNRGAADKVHGMFEVESIPVSTSRNPRSLGSRRFYELPHVIRSVHLVPSNEHCTKSYVNNFIDWDQYNTKVYTTRIF